MEFSNQEKLKLQFIDYKGHSNSGIIIQHFYASMQYENTIAIMKCCCVLKKMEKKFNNNLYKLAKLQFSINVKMMNI